MGEMEQFDLNVCPLSKCLLMIHFVQGELIMTTFFLVFRACIFLILFFYRHVHIYSVVIDCCGALSPGGTVLPNTPLCPLVFYIQNARECVMCNKDNDTQRVPAINPLRLLSVCISMITGGVKLY